MIKNFIIKHRELITYGIFGVLTTIISLGSFKVFDLILGSGNYLISNALSWIIAVTFAYITNKIWVFRSREKGCRAILREVGEFFSGRLFSLGIEELGLWLLIDVFGVGGISITLFGIEISGNMPAKLILQFVVVILNYVFSKFLVFRKRA